MFYSIIRAILGFVSRLLFNVRLQRAEAMPAEGPVILCPNHISWWDVVLLADAIDRPIHFMAKTELFKTRISAAVMRALNGYPVDRGKADLSAIRNSISILRQGKVLGIFPEGHRAGSGGGLGEMRAGAALIALRTGSPVVPVAIRGKYGFRRTVVVRFGDPFVVKGKTGRPSTDLEEGAQMISSAIAALWESVGSDNQ